uniref:DIRP domain-containing protein n=1 Tax=Panagrolaimus superbus TaxID=310955 RepID=A0A914YKG1_9BILA
MESHTDESQDAVENLEIEDKGDTSQEMQENVNRLKNVLKLSKARRFAYCEFFYSPVDAQIFCSENEFLSLVKENLPNLRTKKLRKSEWRVIRRLIGKPRRLSVNFLKEERRTLEEKRAKIQNVYRGEVTQIDPDSVDLPSKLPRPLMVGTKVFAKLSGQKDGVYAGTIDATQDDGYRVVFEKENLFPTTVVTEDQVMSAVPQELLSLSYFLTTNKANLKSQLPPSNNVFLPSQALVERMQQQSVITGYTIDPQSNMSLPVYNTVPQKKTSVRDDKVGNFPVRMLVIIVKMCKLLEHKRSTIKLLRSLNDEAIKLSRYGTQFPKPFVTAFAEVVVDLESINKMLRVYAEALNEYRSNLLNQRSRPVVTDRPEVLRRTCHNHANQILKHCSSVIQVQDEKAKEVIAMLSSLLLQIRFLGQHAISSRSCAEEITILTDSLKELKDSLPADCHAAFQDGVEVHLKQIFNTLLKVRPQNGI